MMRARDAALSELDGVRKLSSVHVQVHNLFNQERYLISRQVYTWTRLVALAEWRALVA
jgi:hypothetical protein